MKELYHLKEVFMVADSDALAALPPPINSLSTEEPQFQDVDPAAIAATALAILASAMGGAATVKTPSSSFIMPAFNLLIVTTADWGPPWLNGLRFGLIAQVAETQCRLQVLRAKKLKDKKNFEESEDDLAVPMLWPPQPGPLVSPTAVNVRMTPADLKAAFEASFDGAVSLGHLGLDPAMDLIHLSAGDRRELLRNLACSWEGLPLSFGRTIRRGCLSLVFATHQAMLIPLLETGFFDQAQVPPILWMPGGSGQAQSLNPDPSTREAWNKAIQGVMAFRSSRKPLTLILDPEAAAAFLEFDDFVRTHSVVPGVPVGNHLAWLPGLALRISLLLAATDGQAEGRIRLPHADGAVLLTKWFASRHIETLHSSGVLSAPASTDKTATTDKSDPAAVMLRKIAKKSPVSRRELWRAYNDPKAAWFNFTLNQLLDEGKVVQDAKGRLELCP